MCVVPTSSFMWGRRHGRAAAAASPDPGGTAARRRRRGALDPVLAEYPSRAVSTENPHSPLRSDLGMQAARAAATARAAAKSRCLAGLEQPRYCAPQPNFAQIVGAATQMRRRRHVTLKRALPSAQRADFFATLTAGRGGGLHNKKIPTETPCRPPAASRTRYRRARPVRGF